MLLGIDIMDAVIEAPARSEDCLYELIRRKGSPRKRAFETEFLIPSLRRVTSPSVLRRIGFFA